MSDATLDGWQRLKLSERKDWANQLSTFTWEGWDAPFESGQYVTLAKPVDGRVIERHYSIASQSGVALELYLTIVPEGELTPLLFAMKPGDDLYCWPKPKGKFMLRKVPEGRDLWLIGTGTGLAPFLSMLRNGTCFDRFEHVVLVHSVRYEEDLGYRDELEALKAERGDAFRYVPATSRADADGVLSGRVTNALEEGRLESFAGLEFSADHSQVMLCGNPAMLTDMKRMLDERGLPMHRRFSPGNVHMEKYW